MLLDKQTIQNIKLLITGDEGPSPYLAGAKLIEFFRNIGDPNADVSPFPSRHIYVENKLNELNDTPFINKIFESLLNPRRFVGNPDALTELVKKLQEHLSLDGYAITENDRGYKINKANQSGLEGPKTLIFGGSRKPTIVIRDVINRDIELSSDSDSFIYNRDIVNALTVQEFIDWWSKFYPNFNVWEKLSETVKNANSPGEMKIFEIYKDFVGLKGQSLPMLIPQVYLHYHSRPVSRTSINDGIVRQRMDFLLITENKAIVLEVDGKQHYSDESGVVNTRKYAEMVREDRKIKLLGYDVYRFGGYEFNNPRVDRELFTFFEELLL